NRRAAGGDAGLWPAAQGTPQTPGGGLCRPGQPGQLGPGRMADPQPADVNGDSLSVFLNSTFISIQNVPPGFPQAGRFLPSLYQAKALSTALATDPAVSMPPAPSSTTMEKA